MNRTRQRTVGRQALRRMIQVGLMALTMRMQRQIISGEIEIGGSVHYGDREHLDAERRYDRYFRRLRPQRPPYPATRHRR